MVDDLLQYKSEAFCDCANEMWEDGCCCRCGRFVNQKETAEVKV